MEMRTVRRGNWGRERGVDAQANADETGASPSSSNVVFFFTMA